MAPRLGSTLSDWYYIVNGTNPTTQVYSTATGTFISNGAAAFTNWLIDGGGRLDVYGSGTRASAMADNGSGKVRLTVGGTQDFQTGQVFYCFGLDGTPLANGVQTITVVDATHIDITAIAFVAGTLAADAGILGAGIQATLAATADTINDTAILIDTPEYINQSIGTNLTLTNPLPFVIVLTPTGADRDLTFPVMNAPNSIPLGRLLILANSSSTFNLNVKDSTGAAMFTLKPRYVVFLENLVNTTAVGLFSGVFLTALGQTASGADIIAATTQLAALVNSVGLGVVGRSAATAGPFAEIVATGGSGAVFRESGSTIGWGTISAAGIATDAVTNAKIIADAVDNTKLANMANGTIKGRITAGTGDPEDIAAGALPGTATNDDAPAGRIGEFMISGHGNGTAQTCTISNATPAVVTAAAHTLSIGATVNFTTTGALPSPLVVGTNYYVSSQSFAAGAFCLSTTSDNAIAGTSINTTTAGSGVHTVVKQMKLTTATNVDMAILNLTAGDWDVWGNVGFVAAATTNATRALSSINTVTGALNVAAGFFGGVPCPNAGLVGGTGWNALAGPVRVSLNATTKYRLVLSPIFTVSTLSAYGTLQARRRR